MNTATAQSTDLFDLPLTVVETGPSEKTALHDLGTGVPAVFIHGSGAGVSAATNWWLNLPTLSAQLRTIALDLIGFGRTDPGPDPRYGIREWGEHVVRVLDALGVERSWLVGNSLGGWIALQLAIDHPDRVAGVVSMGTGGAKRKSAALTGHTAPEVTRAGVRSLLEDFVVDKSLVSDELVEIRLAAAKSADTTGTFAAVMAARERDRNELPLDEVALAQLAMPVLLVHGREDSVIPAVRSWDLARIIPDSELHLYSNCGHWSQVERADEFNRLVLQFIEAHS